MCAEGKPKPATSQNRSVRRMRRAARIVGLVIVVFFLIGALEADFEIAETEGFKVMVFYLQSFLMGLCATIGLVGYVVSWWRELPAGILLVLSGVVLPVILRLPAPFRTPSTPAETSVAMAILAGSPFLVAGVLFLLSWRLSRIIH